MKQDSSPEVFHILLYWQSSPLRGIKFTIYMVFNYLFLNWLSMKIKGLDLWKKRAEMWWAWCLIILVITDNIMDAHQKTHLHTMKVYNTRLVAPHPTHPIKVLLIKMTLFFWRLRCLLAPKYSKLSSDRTLGMTHLLHWSFQSFLLKKCMALWKNFICCQSHALHCSRLSVTSRCLSPVFTVSARNTWDQLIPF